MRIGVSLILVAIFLTSTSLGQDKDKKEDPPKKGGTGGIARVFERTEVQNNLKQLHIAYSLCVEDLKNGPAKQEELAKYYENNNEINEMLKSKWVTMIYGISGRKMRAEPTALLAYETNADRTGQRVVLRCNGGIESLNEEEFKKAPKAK
jgi:hypothetical protein